MGHFHVELDFGIGIRNRGWARRAAPTPGLILSLPFDHLKSGLILTGRQAGRQASEKVVGRAERQAGRQAGRREEGGR